MITRRNRHHPVLTFAIVVGFCVVLLLLVTQGRVWTSWSHSRENLTANHSQSDATGGPGSRELVWRQVDQLPHKIGLHESVFWEPLDTQSLRKLLEDHPDFIKGKSVFEIGTGSGLIALCCKQMGASRVVATDINPQAVNCARENATRMSLPIDVRLVPSTPAWEKSQGSDDGEELPSDSSAYAVLRPEETFDLIVSNPPWEDASPKQWSEYALYDKEFQLLHSILRDGHQHLKPGGRLILVYGCGQAIDVTQQLAEQYGYDVFVMDDRDPAALPDVFLPGMMIGLIPKGANETHNPKSG